MNRSGLPAHLLLVFVGAIALSGCFSITRIESDLYTITERDTTIREDAKNVPGERDNGTIYPSPRTIEIDRRYVQRDSVVNRFYPNFLRAGGIEAASFISPGTSEQGRGNGLFGLYQLLSLKSPDSSKIFGANMYRLMPYEVYLPLFNDDNWTLGTAAYELFTYQKDSSAELDAGESLSGVFPLYIRRRIFLRERPPFVMVVPFIGVSYAPSLYVNLGATFDVGSYGGMNIRAYAGYITGSDWIAARDDPRKDFALDFPYIGIGVSGLDFVNTVPELYVEWKDHKHSAIEVAAANVNLVYSTSSEAGSFINRNSRDSTASFPTGVTVTLASASYPIPVADTNFFVGTSLFNLLALSDREVAFGFLPIRFGYRRSLLGDDLNATVFGELTYYPGTAYHFGVRSALKIYNWVTFNTVAGFVGGSANLDVVTGFEDLQVDDSFSTFYLGVGFGFGDVFHSLETVRKPFLGREE